mgnify:CR=1 FL=1
MADEQQYLISTAKEDLGGILSTLNELKENFESLEGLAQEVKDDLSQASEQLNNVFTSIVKKIDELESAEAEEKEEFLNNEQKMLTKDDRPMPKPSDGETFEQFMTRCMYDTNARTIHPDDQMRFKACMLQTKNQDFRES